MATTSDILRPAAGASVWTSDGTQFGYVKEVKGDYFKVDIPWASDYWLSCVHIAQLDGQRAILRLRKDQLDDHRLGQAGVDSLEEQASRLFLRTRWWNSGRGWNANSKCRRSGAVLACSSPRPAPASTGGPSHRGPPVSCMPAADGLPASAWSSQPPTATVV